MLRLCLVSASRAAPARRATVAAAPAALARVWNNRAACLAPASFAPFSTASTPSNPSADSGSHSDFAPQRKAPAAAASPTVSQSAEEARALIQRDIADNPVFLYMKGNPSQPRCGFSANVVRILQQYPSIQFGSRDVLEDPHVRETIKSFSDWPTLPQLFVQGEFVGGSDIVTDLWRKGELDEILGVQPKQAEQAQEKAQQ